MRTKHLFYAFALAGAFSACTQDEFEAVNTGEALTGRKLLGDVTLVDAPETRLSVDGFNTFKREAGDEMSLLLVDKMNSGLSAQHDYAIDNYTLDSQIWSNFIFRYGATGWSGDAKLVEGNYLFVLPAQEAFERSTITLSMPAQQTYVNGDPTSIIKSFVESGAPVQLGHRFLSVDEPEDRAVPGMQHIWAYPQITVKNPEREGTPEIPSVRKVILKNTSGFALRGQLDNKVAARVLTSEVFSAKGGDTKDQVLVGTWAGNMNSWYGSTKYYGQEASAKTYGQAKWKADGTCADLPKNADFEVTTLDAYGASADAKTYQWRNGLGAKGSNNSDFATSVLMSDENEDIMKGDYIVIDVPDVPLKAGESLTFNAIMPAGTYSSSQLTLYVVLSNGEMFKKIITDSNYRIDMYPGKRYPAQDYTNGLEPTDPGKYFTIGTSTLYSDSYGKTEKASQTDGTDGVYVASTQEELKAAITANTTAKKKTILVTGKDVVYDQSINDIAGNMNCEEIAFQGNINIVGGSNYDNALKIYPKFTFEKATIVSGHVNTAGVSTSGYSLGNLIVKEGATLYFYGGYAYSIDNYGDTYLGSYAYNVYNKNYVGVYVDDWYSDGKIHNWYENCDDQPNEALSQGINYEPYVDVLEGGSYTLYNNLYYTLGVYEGGTVTVDGQISLQDSPNAVDSYWNHGTTTYKKYGKLLNCGTINGTGTLTIAEGKKMENNGEISCNVTISSYLDKNKPAELVNNGTLKGTITNNGVLTLGEDGLINEAVALKGAGELNNTAKHTLPATVASEQQVYAVVNIGDLTDDKVVKALENYSHTGYGINEYRVVSAQTIPQDQDYTADLTIKTWKFMAGSSLTIKAHSTLNLEGANIYWCGKDIPVKGEGTSYSTLVVESEQNGTYLTTDKNGDYVTATGSAEVEGVLICKDVQDGETVTVNTTQWENSIKDQTGVEGAIVIVGSASDPVANLDELLEWAKNNPESEVYASVTRDADKAPYFYAGQQAVSVNNEVLAGLKAANRGKIYVPVADPVFTVGEGITKFGFKYSSTIDNTQEGKDAKRTITVNGQKIETRNGGAYWVEYTKQSDGNYKWTATED